MGNTALQKEFFKFISEYSFPYTITFDEDGNIDEDVAWLSYICVYWVWGKDAQRILYTLRYDTSGDTLNPKSVSDMIYASKRYRRQHKEPLMTDEETHRYKVFMDFKKSKGNHQYHVESITTSDGKIIEYIRDRVFFRPV